MSEIRSPFLVFENFISPKVCEQIVDNIRVERPDVDEKGDPIKMERHHDDFQSLIYGQLKDKIPEIEERYDAKYKGTDSIIFQFFPENSKSAAQAPGCENSRYVRKKWVKVKDVDLTGVLWLKDFNGSVPLDKRMEVYGGKTEFPAYNFSLVPQRGTLTIFPAGPHFITAISPVLVGDLYQVKINITIEPKDGGIWLYQPSEFPGTWQDWFKDFF